MSEKIRIPSFFLKEIVHGLFHNPENDHWEFITRGGSVLRCKKVNGIDLGNKFESIDFEYLED